MERIISKIDEMVDDLLEDYSNKDDMALLKAKAEGMREVQKLLIQADNGKSKKPSQEELEQFFMEA